VDSCILFTASSRYQRLRTETTRTDCGGQITEIQHDLQRILPRQPSRSIPGYLTGCHVNAARSVHSLGSPGRDLRTWTPVTAAMIALRACTL
jgi:hypothetical protein